MDKRILIVAVVSCFYSCQRQTIKLTDAEQNNIIEEIRQTTDSIFAAGNNRDHKQIDIHFSDNATGAWNGSIIESWEKQKKQGHSYYAGLEKVSYTIDTISIDVLSPDVAILVGKYKYSATDTAGKVSSSSPAWTYVFNKQEGKWKIVHFHVSESVSSNLQQVKEPQR